MEQKIIRLSEALKSSNGKVKSDSILKEIDELLITKPKDEDLLKLRAETNIKLQNFGQAINDYKAVLEVNKNNQLAVSQIEQLAIILKYNNTDIYANPNTNLDPWLD